MKNYLQTHLCPVDDTCEFSNQSLESMLEEYQRLGAIPHCCFSEISKQQVIAVIDSAAEKLQLFASATALFEIFPDCEKHAHVNMSHLFTQLGNRRPEIHLYGRAGVVLAISRAESGKLIEQALSAVAQNDKTHSEDFQVEDGQAMIFSTPDPEIPGDFVDYLSAVFAPIHDVSEVYVFETSRDGDSSPANLVIGVVLARKMSRHESDRFSFLLLEGVEKHLEDREALDFMVIEDAELKAIVASVSPVITLKR